jgi:uncharacterized protein YneF (UPF0154 family)
MFSSDPLIIVGTCLLIGMMLVLVASLAIGNNISRKIHQRSMK